MALADDVRAEDSESEKRRPTRSRWKRAYEWLLGQDTLEVVLRLTLLLLIVHPTSGSPRAWYQTLATVSLCLLAFVYPPLRRNPLFWLLLAVFRFVCVNYYDWAFANNHDCLLTYWCLALACSLALPDSKAALALNGRLLVALTFLTAAGWKLSSPEYRDGRTFEYMLYHDSRFFELSRVFADFTFDLGERNHVVFDQMNGLHKTIPLRTDRLYPVLATILTWWTVLIEAAVAILFLAPRRSQMAKWGDVALLFFLATTYPWVGIYAFSWLLGTMGLAQCPLELRRIRCCYMLLPLYAFVFSEGNLKAFLFGLLSS
jgi:hypothetical protein